MRVNRFLICGLAAIALSGCGIMAPQYSASVSNVQALKDSETTGVRVGGFTPAGPSANDGSISLRAASLKSPYGGSFSNYLGEAIKQELALAGKLKENSDIEVSGVLLKNVIDISGFSVGVGEIEARFVVKKNGIPQYEAVKSVKTEFESSFAGAIAIPKGQQEYPNLVQKLVGELFQDPLFAKVLKR